MVDIAVIPGDGIGNEIIPGVCNIIKNINDDINFYYYDISSNRYLKNNITITDNEISELKNYKAILFGAIGDFRVKSGIMEQNVILRLRKDLDLYLNVRPVSSLPKISKYNNVDLTIYRENKEDFYALIDGDLNANKTFTHRDNLNNYEINISGNANDEIHYNMGVLSRKNITRFFKKVFDLIYMGRAVIADKANAISMYSFWREIAMNESRNYEINTSFEYADSLAYNLILDPKKYTNIIAPNLYGDILSDMTSALVGSLGYAPSANIGDKTAMFEPVHGSAPDIANHNIANPVASILSGAMMLEYLDYREDSKLIRNCLFKMLRNDILPVESGGTFGTKEFMDYINKITVEARI